MRAILVLSFDLPTPEEVCDLLDALNPPMLPFFAGEARIAVEPHASAVTRWLDEGHDLPTSSGSEPGGAS